MEDTLGAYRRTCYDTAQNRLNPCSNGRYSRSYFGRYTKSWKVFVLILVLMEDTLGAVNESVINGDKRS